MAPVDRLDLRQAFLQALRLTREPEPPGNRDSLVEGLFGVAIACGKVGTDPCVLHAAISLLSFGLKDAKTLK